MKRSLLFISIAIFSIFIGGQITEGCLLLPYWKTLGATEFYVYYAQFGPSIGKFFTVLTVIAALIPLSYSIYCFAKKSPALKYSVVSTSFAILFVAMFYIYFKDANQQFYDSAFSPEQLKSELITWGQWHWLRVLFEILSLAFLIVTFNVLSKKETTIRAE